MKSNSVPVLFIHGTDDKLVPVEMTYKNYLACTAKRELLIVPGADHAVSCFTDPDRYFAALHDFFDACELEKTPEQICLPITDSDSQRQNF